MLLEVMDLLSQDPQPMRCSDCGATWFSRVAGVVVRVSDLGRCAFCGGTLVLAPTDEAEGEERGEPEPA